MQRKRKRWRWRGGGGETLRGGGELYRGSLWFSGSVVMPASEHCGLTPGNTAPEQDYWGEYSRTARGSFQNVLNSSWKFLGRYTTIVFYGGRILRKWKVCSRGAAGIGGDDVSLLRNHKCSQGIKQIATVFECSLEGCSLVGVWMAVSLAGTCAVGCFITRHRSGLGWPDMV